MNQQDAGPAILIVDDEKEILRIYSKFLRMEGYQVLQAPSPFEAIELFERESSGVALLLTDVMMPDMDGFELARRLRDLDGSLKVLFMSGWCKPMEKEAGVRLLQKPILRRELIEAVAECIAEVPESL